MNRTTKLLAITTVLCATAGCVLFSPRSPYDNVTPYRSPYAMELENANRPRPAALPAAAPVLTDQTSGEKPEIPLRRPLPTPAPSTSDPQVTAPPASEIIEGARNSATQHPSEKHFINAVQVYDFVPGAVYEVITAPGFVTMLYLRPGEELKHLAAGDTSRWLIDTVAAGDADSRVNGLSSDDHVSVAGRVSVLIKPRFPLLQTNLVIATNERIYLIDLRSQEQTYHSAVEWTYPSSPTVIHAESVSRERQPTARKNGVRNYLYSLKAPRGGLPPWAPQAVYDDGHRVYVEFDPSIDDHERPPLYLLDPDGMARMVNYRTESNYYVVDRLFDRAALRIGSQRVVIERVRPRPNAYKQYPRINYTRK
ncbi:MAG: TrbG/VirB9 family P-type conjugative transfer protein [Phycisphaerae bacterium]|nr:TrbG/VirB9 family P-type conjugative transfer protein [Phycisphaerae bacterium]